MEKKCASLKEQSILLRKKGLSYGEIKKQLSIPKSTLSFWLKDVPISEKARKRLYTKHIEFLAKGPKSQRERRLREVEEIVANAQREIELPLSETTYRLIGAFLYWGEGSKTSGFEITNSDPFMIRFMVDWFERVFHVPRETLKARLNIYPQQSENEIKQFWSLTTGIPVANFGKSFVKPASKGYKKNNLYYGTIKVEVPKGTDMRHKVFGWVRATLRDAEPSIEFAQKEWKSLKAVQRPVNLPKQ